MNAPEPTFTIRGPAWAAARARLERVEPAARTLLGDALDRVESGWDAVRELKCYGERRRAAPTTGDESTVLVTFAEAELCEAYRSLARSLSYVVEDWPGSERASPDDADGWLSAFGRYVAVLALATRAAAVPDEFSALVRDLARLGEDGAWYRGFSELIAAMSERSAAEGVAHEAAAAVDILTHAIPGEERAQARRRVVADVEDVYGEAGVPPPPWLRLLKDYYSGLDLPDG